MPATACDARPVTTRGTAHLQLVERPEGTAPAEPTAPVGRTARAVAIVVTTAALALVLAALGGQRWPLPTRVAGAISDVPHSLVSFLLVCTGVCLWAAGTAVRPAGTFRSPAAAQLWWATTGAAALVSIAADLSLAASAGADQPPGDLLARWLVPAVPAVVAGVLARRDGRAARSRSPSPSSPPSAVLTGWGDRR